MLRTRERILSAARGVCKRRSAPLWLHEDVANEVVVKQMQGVAVRLDWIGLTWLLNQILDSLAVSRAAEFRFGYPSAQAVSPVQFALLREVCASAKGAQGEALWTLAERGPVRWGLPRTTTRRHSNALRSLREKWGVRPVSATDPDRWKKTEGK